MGTTTEAHRRYLPAAGRDSLLPLYDPITRLLGLDRLRRALLDQAGLEPQHRVLDVGCGTGSLAVTIKKLHPTVTVVGVDPDRKALARAERKARRTAALVRFDLGFADALAYPDASFDRVFSSMMFHHLESGVKEQSLREIRRVLRPGGRLELVDFWSGRSHPHGPLSRIVHSHAHVRDNVESRIPGLMSAAGFKDARRVGERRSIIGRLGFFQATA
jgi:ubiquinone/menaquinone biosynthesis C-methylase UbiE